MSSIVVKSVLQKLSIFYSHFGIGTRKGERALGVQLERAFGRPVVLGNWTRFRLVSVTHTKVSASCCLIGSSVLRNLVIRSATRIRTFPRLVGLSEIPITPPVVESMGKKAAGGFYAVARGRTVGIYHTWDECKAQVDGFPNARYKKFPTSAEAQTFIDENKDGKGFSSNNSAFAYHKKDDARTGMSNNTFSGPVSSLKSSVKAKSGIHSNSTPGASNPIQKRSFSSLKVTEDRVINKRPKIDQNTSANSGVNLSNFTVDQEGYVVVYTDGACTKNGRKAAKAGIGVWFGNMHPLNISEPVDGRQTNNTAEIQAAERAINQAKKNGRSPKMRMVRYLGVMYEYYDQRKSYRPTIVYIPGINKIKIKTDSQFTINCVTKWLFNWKRNNWRLSSGGDVKNKEDLIKLDEAMQNMEIKWSHVAGHAGIEGNEAADRLAVAGAERSQV